MEVSGDIFKKFSIQGTYGEEINNSVAEYLGRSFGSALVRKGFGSCVLGCYQDEISLSILEAFTRGVLNTGINCTQTGATIEHIISFLTCTQGFDAGVYIKHFSTNSLKSPGDSKDEVSVLLDYTNAAPVSTSDIQYMYHLIKRDDFEYGKGTFEKKDFSAIYVEYMKHKFTYADSLNVGVFIGEGMTGVFAAEVLKNCGFNVKFINEDITKFRLVESEHTNLDIFFGFDTSFGKFVVMDAELNVYHTDRLLLLLSESVLRKNVGSTVVYDSKGIEFIKEFVNSKNGLPVMTKSGYAYFMREMAKGAVLGAEFGGNMYFGDDYFGTADNIFAMCKILEIIEKEGLTINSLMSRYPNSWASPRVNIVCPDELKYGLIDTLSANLMKDSDLISVVNIDGVRAQITKTSWYSIAPSDSFPRIEIRFEGEDYIEARFVLDRIKNVLKTFEFLDITPLDEVQISA